MDFLSNIAYMGTDKGGMRSPADRAEDGRYHIVHSPRPRPHRLRKALALLGRRVLLRAMPHMSRAGACYSAPTHVDNF